MKTAEDIAMSRPPDSVHWTDWEPDPDDTDPPTRTRNIATHTSLFKVLEYEAIPEVMRRERRKRVETWKHREPPRYESTPGSGGVDLVITRVEPPLPQTVSRWEWEYRRRWVPA